MILASNSKRREEILKDAGFHIKIIPANIEEISNEITLEDKIKDIAHKKAYSVAKFNPNEFVLAADTVVEFNNQILGKPQSILEARTFLKTLSSNEHRVITAYSLININKNIYINDVDINIVKFYELDDETIEWYIESKEPFDKAGGYGIQDKGRIFVEKINGDFYSIMGFPIAKFIKKLKSLNIKIKDISKL